MAFLRQVEGQIALVLVNLGDRELRGVELSAPAGAVPPGRYTADSVLDEDAERRDVQVGGDGLLGGWTRDDAVSP